METQLIRKIAKTLPIVCNTLDKLPKFEGWYWCDYYTWSLERKDFISLKRTFFFDGENFRTQCLSDYDGADWIYNVFSILGKENKYDVW